LDPDLADPGTKAKTEKGGVSAMKLKGLVMLATPESFRDAYTHRAHKLGECLQQRSLDVDFYYIDDHTPMQINTLAPFVLPLKMGRFKKYDFIHCAGEEGAHKIFFCRPFLRIPVICDIDGDAVAASAMAREMKSRGRVVTPRLRTKLITRMALAVGDQVLTVCTPHVEELIRSGVPAEKVSLIRNGVDMDLFSPSPQPKDPEFTFGYAGEFQAWQDVDKLFQAMEGVADPVVRFLLIGFRETDAIIKTRFAERFGSRVKLVDWTDQKTVVELLKSVAIPIISRKKHRANLYAFPTRFAEFAALQRPVLVNDVDETADFVRKYDCGFVSEASAEGMARTMTEAANVPTESLAEMGKRARTMAEENFSWQVIGDAYAELIGKVVNRYASEGS
jgi:glycosyltransferase involved in cell wall biosynthesis